MVGVDSGSLYRRTCSLSRLAWSWVSAHMAPFCIRQMNRMNSIINIVLDIILLYHSELETTTWCIVCLLLQPMRVLLTNLNVQMVSVSTSHGDVMKMLIVRMVSMKTPLSAVSVCHLSSSVFLYVAVLIDYHLFNA